MTDENVDRSLRRTKKIVREKCLMGKLNKLITFTTRAAIVEAEQWDRILSRFLRLCRKERCTFPYVLVPERHMSEKTSLKKYGSFHAHLATTGFTPYKQILRLWREAVQWELKDGDFEGANMDVSTRRSNGKKDYFNRSKIASYMSKYISKDIDDENYVPGKKRYWASKGIEKPETIRFFSPPAGHNDTFRAIFEDITGLEVTKMFIPDIQPGQPPIIWMSTG